jgi:prepilin-type N-terminal cleavage/methylation domain-containing protein
MKRTDRGFTLVEVMVVIMIIGVLATVAINFTIRLQERAHTSAIQSDLAAAYKAAAAFYADDPDGVVTREILLDYGYRPTHKVTLTVHDGSEGTLRILADHPGVRNTYQIDHTGAITKT